MAMKRRTFALGTLGGLGVLGGGLHACGGSGGSAADAVAAGPIPPPAPAPAPGASPSLPVAITLAASKPLRPSKPQLLGTNTPWVYHGEGLFDANGQVQAGMWARVQEWAPTVLRYPGGSLSDTYAWRKGIGALAGRDKVLAYEGQPLQAITYGTREFLQTCEALGSEPLVSVNMHGASEAQLVQDAADWVRHVNGQTLLSERTGLALPKVRYWELGNEPYLMDAALPDGRANPLYLRPDQFATRVNLVMAAMRAVDPGLRIGLPFALDTLSGQPWRAGGEPATVVGAQLGFADKLLAGLQRPQDLDFLALHYYMPLISTPATLPSATEGVPSDLALYWGTVAGSETVRRHLGTVADFWARHPRTAQLPLPRLQVTEFNAFYTNARFNGQELKQNAYIATQAAALFTADLLRVLSQDDRVAAATQWSLNGNWFFGAIQAGSAAAPAPVRPAFHVMRLARQLLAEGAQHVEFQLTVATTSQAEARVGFAAAYPDMPLATAMATRRDQLLSVFVINKDPLRAATVTARLADGVMREASLEQVQAAGLFANADTPQAAVVSTRTLTLVDGVASFELGPASFGLLQAQIS